MTKRKRHPEEFKREAVRLLEERGDRPAREVAEGLGVTRGAFTDSLASSQLPELKTLRRTLMRWRTEVLNYFRFRVTNGRTEGFNNKAKVVKRSIASP